jgi:DNA-binding transcriptional regulator YiaG
VAKSFDEMLKKVSPAVRKAALAKAAKDQQKIDAANAVKRIREAAKLGQQQLAEAMGVSQPAVAKLERQHDMRLSTLMAIVSAAGGSMEIRVKLPKGSLVI